MDEQDALAERFEDSRPRLRGVAYRMLGSQAEAEDAVQEAWLRLSRSDAAAIANLDGWLTTVVARVCLDVLRTRRSRREESLDELPPDPVITRDDGSYASLGGREAQDPEQQALQADAVGLALQLVLDRLTPAERLAYVLHDMFGVPFDEIAPIVDRSPDAAKMLASRARRRVRTGDLASGVARSGSSDSPASPASPGSSNSSDDIRRRREVVQAFLAASQSGNFAALLAVLDPQVVLRVDLDGTAAGLRMIHGAEAVASQASMFGARLPAARLVFIDGQPGLLTVIHGKPFSMLTVDVADGVIVAMDILADPEALARLDLSDLPAEPDGSP